MGGSTKVRWIVLVLIWLIWILYTPASSALSSVSVWSMPGYDYENTASYDGNSVLETNSLDLYWTYSAGNWIRSSPIATDLDGDGFLEIIFGSDDQHIYALDSKAVELWRFKTGGRVRASPTAADLDSDGAHEILVASTDNSVYALSSQGNLLWSFPTGGAILSPPIAAELEPLEPGLETLIASTDGNIYILNSQGEFIRKFEIAESMEKTPAVSDLDLDGRLEIIIAGEKSICVISFTEPDIGCMAFDEGSPSTPVILSQGVIVGLEDGNICRLEYLPGSVENERIGATLKAIWYAYTHYRSKICAAAADIFGDDTTELMVSSESGGISIINSGTGEILREYVSEGRIKNQPAIVQTNKGKAAMFAKDSGELELLDLENGISLWGYSYRGIVRTDSVLADLDSDGKTEVILGGDDGRIYVFSSGKLPINTLPTTTTTSTTTTTLTTTTTTSTTIMIITSVTGPTKAATTTSTLPLGTAPISSVNVNSPQVTEDTLKATSTTQVPQNPEFCYPTAIHVTTTRSTFPITSLPAGNLKTTSQVAESDEISLGVVDSNASDSAIDPKKRISKAINGGLFIAACFLGFSVLYIRSSSRNN